MIDAIFIYVPILSNYLQGVLPFGILGGASSNWKIGWVFPQPHCRRSLVISAGLAEQCFSSS